MKHFTARDMVRDLIATGLTQQQIAEKIKVSQATIARVHKGADTRYEAGKRLSDLHRRLCSDRYPPSSPQPTPPDADAAPAERACTDNQDEASYPKRRPGATATTAPLLG